MVFLLLRRIRKDDTSKQRFLKFAVSSWGTHLLSIFTFSVCFKCQTTIKWLTLSSWANSYVIVRGSNFDNALNWSLSTSDGQPLNSSSSRLSSPLQNFLNHHCTVPLLAVPGWDVLLMLQVVSTALWPILNSNKNHLNLLFVWHRVNVHVCVYAQLCPTLCDTWTIACQALLSMEFFWQEYWSGRRAIFFSRGSSQPRNRTRISCVPCIGRLHHFITQVSLSLGYLRNP